jgi:hypothetical protein
MRVSENRVLWRIFERESEEAILGWWKYAWFRIS